MSNTLGEKLRQAREERGISISEVAEQTRISSMYLESIENDNYKPLPGGIFNKGFVKSYAKYVGLDEQEALQDYGHLVSQVEEQIDEAHPRYRPEVLTDDARSSSSIVPTVIFAGIILALMTGGILFVVSYIKNQPETPAVVTNTTNSSANVVSDTSAPGTNTAIPPAPGDIRVEFRALSEKVSVTSTVDGNLAYDEVTPELPKTYTALQGVKLRYYRGFANKVQISLNGKQLVPPSAPAKGKNIEVEINKENFARIFETGKVVADEQPRAEPSRAVVSPAATTATPTTNPRVADASSPRPESSPPRPAFTPLSTPRRSPTPIVVGRPPATRPSPN